MATPAQMWAKFRAQLFTPPTKKGGEPVPHKNVIGSIEKYEAIFLAANKEDVVATIADGFAYTELDRKYAELEKRYRKALAAIVMYRLTIEHVRDGGIDNVIAQLNRSKSAITADLASYLDAQLCADMDEALNEKEQGK